MNIFLANSFMVLPIVVPGFSWGWLCWAYILLGSWGGALISCDNYKLLLCVCVPRKSACSVQLCVIINDDRESGSKAGWGRRVGHRFCGSVVRSAGRSYGFIALATR